MMSIDQGTKTRTYSTGSSEDLIDSVTYDPDNVPRNIDEERRHRQERLVGALRIFGDLGFDEGVAGHVTVRDPENDTRFWTNPYAVHFSQVKISDLVLLSSEGKILNGSKQHVNKAAFAIHHAIHVARPDVVAAAHAHSVYGRAWAALGRPVAPIVQEACAFYENHAIYNDYNGIILEEDQSQAMARALGDKRAITLRWHGNITVGGSVAEAAWWLITLDKCCHIQLLAEAAAGHVEPMSRDEALTAGRQFASPSKARLSFEMLYRVALEKHPDMLK